MKLYYFYTLVKLRCIMGCPGLKRNYREKGLLGTFKKFNKITLLFNFYEIVVSGRRKSKTQFFSEVLKTSTDYAISIHILIVN